MSKETDKTKRKIVEAWRRGQEWAYPRMVAGETIRLPLHYYIPPASVAFNDGVLIDRTVIHTADYHIRHIIDCGVIVGKSGDVETIVKFWRLDDG